MTIKILGSGCKKCLTLAENAKKAVFEAGLSADIVKVSDYSEIAEFGVMSTPALVVNGKVVSVGKVLKPSEIILILKASIPVLK